MASFAPKAHRVDVELSHERNPRESQTSAEVEITVRGQGPVIRAEASARSRRPRWTSRSASCWSGCAGPMTRQGAPRPARARDAAPGRAETWPRQRVDVEVTVTPWRTGRAAPTRTVPDRWTQLRRGAGEARW